MWVVFLVFCLCLFRGLVVFCFFLILYSFIVGYGEFLLGVCGVRLFIYVEIVFVVVFEIKYDLLGVVGFVLFGVFFVCGL